MPEDEYKPPKPTARDHLHRLARAGIGSLPLVGAPANELLAMLVKPPVEKRLEDWREEVGHALLELEAKCNVRLEDLRSDDAFVDTTLQAAQAATRTSRKEKLRALRNAVLNAALPNAPDESLQQVFVNLIDTFTEWHVRVLRLLDAPSDCSRHLPTDVVHMFEKHIDVVKKVYPKLAADSNLLSLFAKELYDRGLLKTWDLGTDRWNPGPWTCPLTTDLGRQFLRFITEPEAFG